MPYDVHKNFVVSTIATAPSPASSGTSLIVHAGDGALFPTAPFNCTVWPSGVQPTSINAEIVRVTGISTDTFTIVRSQEGTSARTILVTDQIANSISVKIITDIENNKVEKSGDTMSGALTISPGSATALILGSSGTTITTANTQLLLQQTGDTFGTSYLSVQNRAGAAGAIFGNAGLDLVDFGFLPNSGVQSNIRLEHRSGALIYTGNTNGEFQFSNAATGTTGFSTGIGTGGNNGTIFSGVVGINTLNPLGPLHVQSRGPSDAPFILQMASGQSQNPFYLTNSSGGTVAAIDSTGKFIMPGFQLTTTPTSGYVLTSDASGNGSWVTPAYDGPVASSSVSLTAGTAYQNLSGKTQIIAGVITITAAVGATVSLGMGATSTPTGQPISPSLSAATQLPFTSRVPNNSYLLITTSGTITVGSITAIAT